MLELLSTQSLLEQWSLLQITGAFLFFSLPIYLVYLSIMNRYFHPLSKFPGPFWASITPLYHIYVFLKAEEHITIEKLHKKYGPVFRYAPDLLAFADPKMIPIIYHRYADKTEYRVDIPGEAMHVLAYEGHKEHAACRKRIAGPYSMSAAREMEPMIDDRIREWKSKIDEGYVQTGAKLDYAKWSQYFAYDGDSSIASVISEVAFGKPFGFMATDSDVNGLINAFHVGFRILIVIVRWESLKKLLGHPFVAKYLRPDMNKDVGIGHMIEERNKLVDERIRLTEKLERIDMMQHFLNNSKTEGGMTIPEVRSELLNIMFAGSDTTAATLRGILINVLLTPGCYDRLIAEIDDYVNSRPEFSVISYDDAQNLKYLTACIKESMRYSPSSPTILPRASGKGGFTLEDGRYIPEGVKLTSNSHVSQRNKELYGEDADVFNPDRWLESDVKVKNMERYDLHFGAGARVCLGKNIAYLELWKGTFEFFRTYKITLIEPEKIKFINMAILTHENLWLNLEKRV